jgi:hypothetical protein
LPQAVQLAATHFREDLVLRASAILEAKMPVQHPNDALWLSGQELIDRSSAIACAHCGGTE